MDAIKTVAARLTIGRAGMISGARGDVLALPVAEAARLQAAGEVEVQDADDRAAVAAYVGAAETTQAARAGVETAAKPAAKVKTKGGK